MNCNVEKVAYNINRGHIYINNHLYYVIEMKIPPVMAAKLIKYLGIKLTRKLTKPLCVILNTKTLLAHNRRDKQMNEIPDSQEALTS